MIRRVPLFHGHEHEPRYYSDSVCSHSFAIGPAHLGVAAFGSRTSASHSSSCASPTSGTAPERPHAELMVYVMNQNATLVPST
jgi:hypothetical protein